MGMLMLSWLIIIAFGCAPFPLLIWANSPLWLMIGQVVVSSLVCRAWFLLNVWLHRWRSVRASVTAETQSLRRQLGLEEATLSVRDLCEAAKAHSVEATAVANKLDGLIERLAHAEVRVERISSNFDETDFRIPRILLAILYGVLLATRHPCSRCCVIALLTLVHHYLAYRLSKAWAKRCLEFINR